MMPVSVIFDGRDLYKTEAMERAGFVYYSVGRAAVGAATKQRV